MPTRGIIGLLLGAFILAAIFAPYTMAGPIIAFALAVIASSMPMKKKH